MVASRYPLRHDGADHRWQRPGHWPRTDMLHCTIQSPGRDIDFCSVHLQSPHDGLSAVLDRQTVLRPSDGPALAAEIEQRRQESEDAQRWVERISVVADPGRRFQPAGRQRHLSPVLVRVSAMRSPRPAWDSAIRNGRGCAAAFRHQNRPRLDGARLAVPPLLGWAGRGLRPSSPAGRTLAAHGTFHRNRAGGGAMTPPEPLAD